MNLSDFQQAIAMAHEAFSEEIAQAYHNLNSRVREARSLFLGDPTEQSAPSDPVEWPRHKQPEKY